MQGGEPNEFFEKVRQFAARTEALRGKLIAGGLRKVSLTISFHAANALSFVQIHSHEEAADYIESAQRLLARLDRQLDHDAHTLQSLGRTRAADNMLENLEKRADNLMSITPLSENIHIPYADMTPEEREDALADLGLPLTQAFLKATLARQGVSVEEIDIKVEPAAEDEIKKAMQLGGLSPGQQKGLIVTAAAMPGLGDLRVR